MEPLKRGIRLELYKIYVYFWKIIDEKKNDFVSHRWIILGRLSSMFVVGHRSEFNDASLSKAKILLSDKFSKSNHYTFKNDLPPPSNDGFCPSQ